MLVDKDVIAHRGIGMRAMPGRGTGRGLAP